MDLILIVVMLYIAAVVTYQATSSLRAGQRVSTKQTPLFIDTSVLIDGRIIAIAMSGFLTRPLYIPRSVVGELQLLADGGDSDKRTRARHGLDVVKELQAITLITVVIFDDGQSAPEGVDNRLLTLAKKHNGAICTIDYNLNKVAQVENIEVLNVNDLAKSLRMAYLPGEKMLLELTQKGNDSHQAIGHLSDGTMVVVEHASQYVGKKMEIEFIRSLQTAAGKMMFAKIVAGSASPAPKQAALKPRKAINKDPGGRNNKQQPVEQPEAPVQPQQAVEAAPAQKDTQPAAQPQQPPRRQQNARPQRQQQGAQKTETPASNTQPQNSRPQNPRRRKTNEDRLVELANQ